MSMEEKPNHRPVLAAAFVAAGIVVVALIIGLSNGGNSGSPEPPLPGTAIEEPTERAEPVSQPEPARDGLTIPDQYKAAYNTASDLCGIVGPKEMAGTYGGDPSDPSSVAAAYAEESMMDDYVEYAKLGCLHGLAQR